MRNWKVIQRVPRNISHWAPGGRHWIGSKPLDPLVFHVSQCWSKMANTGEQGKASVEIVGCLMLDERGSWAPKSRGSMPPHKAQYQSKVWVLCCHFSLIPHVGFFCSNPQGTSFSTRVWHMENLSGFTCLYSIRQSYSQKRDLFRLSKPVYSTEFG